MFTVYKASAGSGKTTRLVSEYLSLCFTNPANFRNILAVTFTNNATAEMKERIVDTLSQLAFFTPDNYSKSLENIYKKIQDTLSDKHLDNSPEKICQTAKLILQDILYDYDNFSISTIDSFFQRILRAFSFEFGLNLNFDLKIELDELFQQTIDTLINKLSVDNKQLTHKILNLLKQNMQEKGTWKLNKKLTEILNCLFDEKTATILKSFESISPEDFENAKKYLKKQLVPINENSQNCQNELDSYLNDKGLTLPFFKIPPEEQSTYNEDTFRNIIDTKLKIKKNKAQIPDNIDAVLPELYSIYAKLKESRSKSEEINYLYRNIDSAAIMFDLMDIVKEIKQYDNLFYLSETNPMIADNIEDSDTPYIYEKIGNKYSFYFIDEFQDTSKLQWENFIPLLSNALSGQNGRASMGEVKLFGDVKQAIYRFRNGDSSLLHSLSSLQGYQKQIQPNDRNGEFYEVNEQLNTNYRSTLSIVHFNNLFYSFFSNQLNYTEICEYYNPNNLQQKTSPNAKKGFVSVLFRDSKCEMKSMDSICVNTLQTIQEIIDSHEFSYSDIAVLTSGNNTAQNIGNYLITNNIPVISKDSLLLNASPLINLLVSTLEYLSNDSNPLAKLYIAKYLSPDTKVSQIIEKISSKEGFCSFVRKNGIEIPDSLKNMPLYTLINELLCRYHLTTTDPFVIKFLDIVDEYLSKNTDNLYQFIEWWEIKSPKCSLSFPKGLNAVTISTIHKAKGLSYPIVIFPFSRYPYTNTESEKWIPNQDKNLGLPYLRVSCSSTNGIPQAYSQMAEDEKMRSLLDTLNKIYVATTRPEQYLYIITEKRGKGNFSKYLDLFIKDHMAENQENNGNRLWYVDDKFYTEPQQLTDLRPKKIEQTSAISAEPQHQFETLQRLHTASFCYNNNDLVFDKLKPESEEIEKGNYIHHFLAKLTSFPQNEEDIDKCIQGVEERYNPSILNCLKKLMAMEEYQTLFLSGMPTMNEATIITPTGEIYRPDRVVIGDNCVYVIDYKTGSCKKEHEDQITRYCQLIEQMGYQHVEGKLLYLHTDAC